MVQHSFANTFTGYIPATYMKTGLQVTVDAGAGVSTTITNMKVGAPSKVVMTMFDAHYFSQTTGNYPANTGSSYTINMAVAEFPAQPPLPNRWIQTGGGTRNWTAGANWDDGFVPNPASGATMDFSTVNIASNTNLVLGADRTAELWRFGATSGTNNRISGTGTVTLNGDFDIDTTAVDASALTSGSWLIVDTANLTESFSASFTLLGAGWSESANVWTKTEGAKDYTFTEATGILELSSATSYASWIDGYFPGVTDQAIIGANADPDNDGIDNGLEMVLGGNPATGMDAALLPTLEMVTDPVSTPAIPAGNYLLFTYRRSDLSVTAGVIADCETNTDLAAPWTTVTGATPGVVIQVDDNFTFTPPAGAATDRVRVLCATRLEQHAVRSSQGPGSMNPAP